jgi:proline racemase
MHVIDSHTGGEPTRVILSGGPDLGGGSLEEQAQRLATDHRDFLSAVLAEPRGQPAMVAALLVPPTSPDSVTGVIYFDVAAVIGMCGHGTIGLAVTLAHLGRIKPGQHQIDTRAGAVGVELLDPNTVRVRNIESRLVQQDLSIDVPGLGRVTGDVAYGGNWFFIIDPSPIAVETGNIRAMTDLAITIRDAANAQGARGEQGEPIDHVIFQHSVPDPAVHSRSFVLCPDDTYDRSPCGTGSSARLASLAARGLLEPGAEIVHESVIGSRFTVSYQPGLKSGVLPTLVGQAHIMGTSTLVFEPTDPFRDGVAF